MVGASRSNSKSKSQSVEVIEPTNMEVDGEQQEVDGNGLNDAQEEGEEEKDDDLPAGDDKEEDAGEDDDEEEEEGEFEVEAVVDHRAGDAAGKYEYLVSWKGYGPDHNTWEPEAHLSHAEDLVSTYWRERPKKSIKAGPPSNKRGRSSTSSTPPPPKSARASNGRPKRKSPPVEADDDVIEDTHPDDLAKYIDIENWEDLVASIDTVERGPDDTLIVYMTMTGGEKGGMPTEVAYKRCPQKILSFYESHLKWRKV